MIAKSTSKWVIEVSCQDYRTLSQIVEGMKPAIKTPRISKIIHEIMNGAFVLLHPCPRRVGYPLYFEKAFVAINNMIDNIIVEDYGVGAIVAGTVKSGASKPKVVVAELRGRELELSVINKNIRNLNNKNIIRAMAPLEVQKYIREGFYDVTRIGRIWFIRLGGWRHSPRVPSWAWTIENAKTRMFENYFIEAEIAYLKHTIKGFRIFVYNPIVRHKYFEKPMTPGRGLYEVIWKKYLDTITWKDNYIVVNTGKKRYVPDREPYIKMLLATIS